MLKQSIKDELKPYKLGLYAFVLVSITVVISIFDYKPDPYQWFLEVLRNFTLSICVGLFILISSIIFKLLVFNNRWVKYCVRIVFWTIGGILGACLGWLINDLLFDFNITHPYLFFLIIASISIIVSIFSTGYIFLKDQIVKMAEKISKNEIEKHRLLKLHANSKLEALKSKVNPHFFFNTLNTVAELIPTNPEKAEKLIEQFSELFRYPFSEENNDFVALKKETEFIKDYLEIEKTRLGERLEYDVYCDDVSEEILIPVMIIQPLIENSIIHGISKLKEGGKISLSCNLSNNYCNIKITDTGKGFGIGGVEERLELLYEDNYIFDIRSNKGVEILLKIPLKTK